MADEELPLDPTPSKVQGRVIQKPVPGGFDYVELTGHAVEQMQIRRFDDEDVYQALCAPDEKELPATPGRKRVRKNKNARTAIDVVYQEIGHHIRVITVIRIDKQPTIRRRRKS